MLKWEQIRHFVVLAEEGSLSSAARRLQVEHATVARRVAALEEATGLKLVDRRSGRYRLTSEGERIAKHGRQMEEAAFAIERVARGKQETVTTDLSVSAPPIIASLLIAPRLQYLRTTYPEILLQLRGDNRIVSLRRKEADIAVRLIRPDSGNLVARKIGSVTYGFYASSEYFEGRRDEDHDYIVFDESLADVPQQKWMLGIVSGARVALRVNDLGIQASAAAAGVGIAVLPSFVADIHGLVDADPEKRTFTRDVWLAFHEDLRGNRAIGTVAEFLADCIGAPRAM